MTTEKKVIIGITLVSLIILGGATWLISAQSSKEEAKLAQTLKGAEVTSQGGGHVADGTQVQYNSNPPTSGSHYNNPQLAGSYDSAPPDGNLVHSLEHGAVILWYKADLPATDSAKLKLIFDNVSVSKKIMVPRSSLDVPVALTSWGRILKLQTIDENQIKSFLETNEDRGPEKAPL